MGRFDARLARLEATRPLPIPQAQERTPIDWAAFVAEIEAESTRVAAMPPKQRLSHIHDEIARRQRRAEEPVSITNEIAARLHALDVKLAKDDYPTERYEIRRCELALLREAGYDVAQLEAEHRKFADLPWQWVHFGQPLPPALQEVIDDILFDA